MTLAAETGGVPIWQRGDVPRADRYRYFGYGSVTLGADGAVGPLALAARVSRLSENETVLGAQFGTALGGAGATSWFADGHATLTPLDNWELSAQVRQGWTLVPAGLARGPSTIQSQALALSIARTSMFMRGDSLALRWSEPLRVTNGGIDLTGFGVISLAPGGHERDLEGVYARALGDGALTLNGYWRQQPGNFAVAPDDLGMAMRYTLGF